MDFVNSCTIQVMLVYQILRGLWVRSLGLFILVIPLMHQTSMTLDKTESYEYVTLHTLGGNGRWSTSQKTKNMSVHQNSPNKCSNSLWRRVISKLEERLPQEQELETISLISMEWWQVQSMAGLHSLGLHNRSDNLFFFFFFFNQQSRQSISFNSIFP